MARDQRRLAAIVSADVEGYSRLMGQDESGTLAALKAHRREVIDPKIAEYGGRIVKTTGDGLLLEFPSVVDAVRCAVEVQQDMSGHNTGVPEERQIQFRIGINVGDIIIDDDDIFGDGVNVAARLQTLADPGGICASRVVRDHVLDKLSFTFESIGAQTVKNIARPIEVYRIRDDHAGGSTIGARPVLSLGTRLAAAPFSPSSSPLSILVLPFANHTGLESRAYIADAMTTSVTSDLTRLSDVFVVPAATAFTYKHRSLTLPSVGREAGVRFVLQGSVMSSGRHLRIAAQLADTRTDCQLWNETFEGDVQNLFALLDQVTARVGNSIAPLMVIAAAPASDCQVTDAAVGDLLLRARALQVQTQSLERFAEIESIYRQVLQRDSANLSAMAGLAGILAVHADWLAPYEYTDPASIQKLTEARDLALAVKAVDPSDARVYFPIAVYAQHVDDFEAARKAWESVVRLRPKSPSAHLNLAVFRLVMGEPARAIPLLEKSLELDPKGDANVFTTLGAANFALGDNDAAIDWLLKALDLNLDHLDIFSYLAMAYANKGDATKSAEFAEQYRRRAEAAGVKGPRVNKPRPNSPTAYVSFFYDKLLPDWERAGLP